MSTATAEFWLEDFPLSYRLRMIQAYPVIAQMDADEEYHATAEERDAAFTQVMNARNLALTHRMYVAALPPLLPLEHADSCGGYLHDCARRGACMCDRMGRE